MAYRDENEALRARVEDLERALADARSEIARLRGEERARDAGGRELTLGERLMGGPIELRAERAIEGEIGERGRERMVERLRESFGTIGETSVLGGTVAWRAYAMNGPRAIEATIVVRDGTTRVRVVERLGQLAGGLFGGVVGGAGGGGLGAILPLTMWIDPTLGLVAAPAWIGAVYAIVRSAYGAIARRRARALEDVADELARIAREGAPSESARVRVEAHAVDEAGAAEEVEGDGPRARSARRA